ncbi:MAG: hypothetical protein COC20_07900 [Cellvibrionales bacterium]|nr:MAG: hypothetical protein COC20_07900 [Cellvibrionales bacterium]
MKRQFFARSTGSNAQNPADLLAGKTSIQKEASRCFDAWSKMYQRGLKREGILGNDDSFVYL